MAERRKMQDAICGRCRARRYDARVVHQEFHAMLKRSVFVLASLLAAAANAQQAPVTFKSAVVGLTEDAELRRSFESELVAIAKAHAYDAVTSYDITSDVKSLDTDEFLK